MTHKDRGIIKEIKYPYIKIENSYNGRIHGCWEIDSPCIDNLNKEIWKPGAYVIGTFSDINEEVMITIVNEDLWNLWLTDNNEFENKITTNLKETEHFKYPYLKHQGDNNYIEICTNRQVIVYRVNENQFSLYKQYDQLLQESKNFSESINFLVKYSTIPQDMFTILLNKCQEFDEKLKTFTKNK